MTHQDKALILIAEDEPKIAALLRDYIEASYMQTLIVDDGDKVVAAVRDRCPDAVLLDVMLPNKDGMAICREIRGFSEIPIIMVTARVEEIDRLLGLELGADDYVCKPFSPREVVARIKSVLRRVRKGRSDGSQTTQLEIDNQRYRASLNGQRLDLTPVEFRLLITLADHMGRVYSRSQLLDLLYDDFRDSSDRTIDSHIKNIRKKIAQIIPNQQIIFSVYGVGYKLELP